MVVLRTPNSSLSRKPGLAALPWSSPAWWWDIPAPDIETEEELVFVCLLRRVIGPGGPSNPSNMVVPKELCRSCEARGTTVHLACGRQGSAVSLMSPGGQK